LNILERPSRENFIPFEETRPWRFGLKVERKFECTKKRIIKTELIF
jgi:hypothetical protein